LNILKQRQNGFVGLATKSPGQASLSGGNELFITKHKTYVNIKIQGHRRFRLTTFSCADVIT
jgi:hypothetical protein